MSNNYVVATIKEWQIEQFNSTCTALDGNWSLITEQAQLTLKNLRAIQPKYIFFPHWSWIVPQEILNEFTCVCFHMTDVPYGRGGSPLQNLIVRGHQATKLSALKMTTELDAGPVYLKAPLSLKGNAQEIYELSAVLTFEMISTISKFEPEAVVQTGDITHFQRRTPEQSEIKGNEETSTLYDLIRMLDAKSYPKAFLHYGDYTLTFDNAVLSDNNALSDHLLTAQVTFTKRS